ncbi:hypothetical protein PNEG_00176 [Pneumocystis murina B123]|uniref:Uncharacterized protein n=1 Tax=Pneumocystis murina (strain B123) TaxID=1069680 RepID=M7NWT6_PNEMU|nr:hypothetical protein PNEG_00176 [Pneumocystis murina B123]EMR11742.1 hypothetical protein PNEG_00176 [Pneumocystis murina B123]
MVNTAFDVFLLELDTLKESASSILFPSINSSLTSENGSGDEYTNEIFWCNKAEKLATLEQEIHEYQSNKTLKNIEKTLDKLQYQIDQILQIHFSETRNTKK